MDILESIDHAIEDFSVSADAMRWTPEKAGVPQPKDVIEPLNWDGWRQLGYVDERTTIRERIAEVTQLRMDILRMYFELPPRDRRDSEWHISPQLYTRLLRDMRPYDDTCVPSSRPGVPDVLCGLPVVVDENLRESVVLVTTQWMSTRMHL